MRELMGKIPTKDPDINEEVYLSEMVRCSECQMTVPVGIEVVTIKKDGKSKKLIRHVGTAAHMVMSMKRRSKVCRFVPMLSIGGSRIDALGVMSAFDPKRTLAITGEMVNNATVNGGSHGNIDAQVAGKGS